MRIAANQFAVTSCIQNNLKIMEAAIERAARENVQQRHPEQEQTAKEQKKRLRQVEKRIAELDELIKKLYEGNASGKIPDKHFNRLLVDFVALVCYG